MVGDFIFITLTFLIHMVFIPFQAVTVVISTFYTVLHWIILYYFMFWHILFLDVVLGYLLLMLSFEGGIFAITSFQRVRGWVSGSDSI